MTTSAKIRLLLAVVCASLLLTAIIVKETFTPSANLHQTGVLLQSNLNKKEAFVNALLGDKARFEQLKHITDNPASAVDLIKDFTTDKRIWAFTYRNNQLLFWSGIKILPDHPNQFKEGPSFIKRPNGYYQVIKKTEGNFIALFIIPVKSVYPFHNRFLHNAFDKNLLQEDNIDIADFTDRDVFNIHAINHAYLFSVKLKPGALNLSFFNIEFYLLLFGLIALCILVHKSCNYIAAKGYTYAAIAVLGAAIAILRIVALRYSWPPVPVFEIFRPNLYTAGPVFRSLGDFCLDIMSGYWLAAFIYQFRHRLIKSIDSKLVSYLIIITGGAFLILLTTLLERLYYGLVINSHISFDVTNVFNLTGYSFIGMLMLCFSFLMFYLLNDTFLVLAKRLPIPEKHKMIILGAFILLATVASAFFNYLTFYYILIGVFMAIRIHAVWYTDGKLNSFAFLSLITVCALIASLKLNYFQHIRDLDIRRALIQKLETADDMAADSSFRRIEISIAADAAAINFFNDKNSDNDYLRNYLQQTYFDGYLSRYNLKLYTYNADGAPVAPGQAYGLSDFRDMVAYSSIKVSEHFYRDNDVFGFQRYFAVLPINGKAGTLGTVVVELRSKPLLANPTFPELLVDGDTRVEPAYRYYSYAFYIDGRLFNQNGEYPYRLQNTIFKGEVKKYTTVNTQLKASAKWYRPLLRESHLIYQPTRRNMIVVSHEEDPVEQFVTSLTFFFVLLLAFGGIAIFVSWLWSRIRIFSVKNKRFSWSLVLDLDRIPYRSRIQFSVMLTVVFTLILVGVITFQSITAQNEDQRNQAIVDKLRSIGVIFEEGLQRGYYSTTNAGQVKFSEFANTYLVDLTLFSIKGVPLLTTQPKIYNYGLLARRMNGRAYMVMTGEHQSQLLNDEKLGDLAYKAVYVPVKNAQQETEAFLQLPYFNLTEYNERTGELLNAMINVYAIIFIAIGVFAIVIARQITAPLEFIQHSFSTMVYGKKNEPIEWKRDDEIGALVREYNRMIAELERSARRLAQSEREIAWREMAKQVAHEIKNPLTPLKLGLQLLDKAWKDKDPKFDTKFERFSKSFVEQIDSLSSIASEFSAFAKMPDTKLERLDLFDVISKAVTIFRQTNDLTITYTPGDAFFIEADRDQMLRCFNNLLKNAIEAMPEGRHGVITIIHSINSRDITISLSDNGDGIPENVREKIFVPNFTTKSSGTGLGLAFVKNSIENSGGHIWFVTETGKGTTFYITWTESHTPQQV